MSRIIRELRRNPLGCSKDVFENADVPVQINSMPYPEEGSKCEKPEDHPPLKDIYKKEDGVGKKSHEGKFSNCFVHQ